MSDWARRWRPLALKLGLGAAGLVVLASWALSSPPGSSPDDPYHLRNIWCALDGVSGQCDPGPTDDTVVIPTFLDHRACYAFQPAESGACQTDQWELELVVYEDRHKEDLYPPVFYSTMALLVTSRPVQSIMSMRILNVVIGVGLFAAVYAIAGRSVRQALAASWLVTSVPLGLFIITSNNPSSWTTIGVGIFWAAFLAYWEADDRMTMKIGGALAVASGTLAIGSRGDGAAYVLLAIGLVLFADCLRPGGIAALRRKALILPGVISVAALIVFFRVRQTEVLVEGFDVGQEPRPGSEVWFFNLTELPSLWAGALGGAGWGLGWLDTRMPSAVWMPVIGAYSMLLYAGLRVLDRAKIAAVAILGLTLSAMPLWVLAQAHQTVGMSIQPRYLLPVMYMLVGFVLLTPDRSRGLALNRASRLAIVVATSVGHSVALHTNLRRYVTGSDVVGFDLNVGREWWWSGVPPPMTLWLVSTICFAALALATMSRFEPLPRSELEAVAAVG